LKAIREYAETSSVRFASLFSPEIRDAVSYAKALNVELERIRPKPYFERDELEGLVEKHPSGFLLYGDPGCGKTTLLQSIALRQTKKAIQQPRNGRIPIFFPSRYLKNGDIDILSNCGDKRADFQNSSVNASINGSYRANC